MRMPSLFRRWRTRIPLVSGEWSRVDGDTISDSVIGVLSRRASEKVFDANITLGAEKVPCWIHDGPNLEDSLTFLRSVARALPRLDGRYRRYAAIDLLEFRKTLGKRQVSDQAFCARLRLQSIEIWFPAADPRIGANIWYTAGDLLGGMRVCIALDSRRRLRSFGVG